MPYRLLLIALFSACVPAQSPSDLVRYRRTLQENLDKLRNYTCDVTIERFHKKSRKAVFEEADRVRIEVGFINQNELFGWPGGERVEEADVARLVGGTIGNGDFALNARALLAVPERAFKAVAGEPRFEFSVAPEVSDWTLLSAEGRVQAGYRGTVWFDQASARIVRLEVTASGQPLQRLGFDHVTKTLRYGLVSDANGSTLLLPESSELHIVEPNGAETKNQTRFQACRMFSAESKLLTGQTPTETTKSAAETVAAALPADFEIPLELTAPIDSAQAAVGDLVSLLIGDSVRHRNETPIQKGDRAIARISRLELVDGKRHLEFMVLAVESGGKRLPLSSRTNFVGRKTERPQFRANMKAEARATTSVVASAELGPIETKARLELPAGTRLILRSSAR